MGVIILWEELKKMMDVHFALIKTVKTAYIIRLCVMSKG